ncbi:MAG TPA: hypothetical protein DIU07_20730, partial [Rhodobacteraceae bacterium]|nr:hypothetical protein [Paracoccaceae bacterium]
MLVVRMAPKFEFCLRECLLKGQRSYRPPDTARNRNNLPIWRETKTSEAIMSHPARLEYVSANDLLTGEVVFLASDGRWVQDLGGAMFFADPDEGALRLIQAGADAGRVVGPCLADAAQDGAQ